ncbi:phosphopantetheine-binding protein [Streptomyces sp. NPDC001407]|uniref:MmcE n=1 Tax=Streptomyces lavendulae TaxID=1914 RepID=Q9X5S3_STRLA|nr:MmcE [Streptomyces lavendulae]
MPRGETGTAAARVAVCTLSSRELVGPLARLPGVAAAGTLMTANLGIEQVIKALRCDRTVRGLLVCGRDSPRFRAGQSLIALFRHGLRPEDGHIRGATGYLPVLRSVTARETEEVRARVELVDARGERDVETLRAEVAALLARVRRTPALPSREHDGGQPSFVEPDFGRLHPVGRRRSLDAGIGGFVLISVDREHRRILLRHYTSDVRPRHEMWGTRGEAMLLGLLEAGVIEDPAHAGYLGAELAKAETALRLGLHYEQDLPLRPPGRPPGPVRRRTAKERTTMAQAPALEDFLRLVTRTLGAEDAVLDLHTPLGEQLAVDSARLIELTVVLEEELGADLPDDADLARATPAELHKALVG